MTPAHGTPSKDTGVRTAHSVLTPPEDRALREKMNFRKRCLPGGPGCTLPMCFQTVTLEMTSLYGPIRSINDSGLR